MVSEQNDFVVHIIQCFQLEHLFTNCNLFFKALCLFYLIKDSGTWRLLEIASISICFDLVYVQTLEEKISERVAFCKQITSTLLEAYSCRLIWFSFHHSNKFAFSSGSASIFAHLGSVIFVCEHNKLWCITMLVFSYQ